MACMAARRGPDGRVSARVATLPGAALRRRLSVMTMSKKRTLSLSCPLIVARAVAWFLLAREPVALPVVPTGVPHETTTTLPGSGASAAADTSGTGRRVSAAFLVKVLDGKRQPLAGSNVVIWREGVTEVREQTTGAEGTARFAAVAGSGGVVAIAADGTRQVVCPVELRANVESSWEVGLPWRASSSWMDSRHHRGWSSLSGLVAQDFLVPRTISKTGCTEGANRARLAPKRVVPSSSSGCLTPGRGC